MRFFLNWQSPRPEGRKSCKVSAGKRRQKSEARRRAWGRRSLQLAGGGSGLLIRHRQPGPWTCQGQEAELGNLREPGQAGEGAPGARTSTPHPRRLLNWHVPKPEPPVTVPSSFCSPVQECGISGRGSGSRPPPLSCGIYLSHLLSLGPHALTTEQSQYHQTKWGVGRMS